MANQLEIDFGTSVYSEYDADGYLGCSIDHCGEQNAGAPPAQILYPMGSLGRPLDPDVDGEGQPSAGCSVMWFRHGDTISAMPLDDQRATKALPKLRKGGYMTFCPAAFAEKDGSFAVFEGKDPAGGARAGSYTLGVKYKNLTGASKSHVLSLGKRTAGKEEVSLRHGEGMGLVMTGGGTKSATLRNASGTAYIEVNDKGIVFNGPVKMNGAFNAGGPGAQPLALGPVVVAALSALVAAMTTDKAAATAALAPFLALIPTKIQKGS
jgi:hypothetical protein